MKPKSRYSTLLRSVAAIVVAAFLVQDLAYAQGGRAVAAAGLPQVPHHLGVVRASHPGDEATIIQIEDAHDSLEAQEKITGILHLLSSEYDVRQVALEGSSGRIDPSLFTTYPDATWARKTAGDLVKQGRLNAGELFAVTSEKPVLVHGAEDKTLYRENLEAFRRLLENREKTAGQIAGLRKTISVLEERVYGKDLLFLKHAPDEDFQKKWERLRRGRQDQDALEEYPVLRRLEEVLSLEASIHFQKANEERSALLEKLREKLDVRGADDLAKRSVEFKAGRLSDGEYHAYLLAAAQNRDVSVEPFPNLTRFAAYSAAFEKLDLFRLLQELEAFEESLARANFSTEDQKTLYDLSREAEILAHLLEGTASSREYNDWKSRRVPFDAQAFGINLEALAKNYHVPFYEELDAAALLQGLPLAERFYDLAEARNEKLLANTLKRMREGNHRVAALVTGGFHTQGLTNLLKEEKLSHLIVMPKITDASKKRPYITILTRKGREYAQDLAGSSRFKIALGTFMDIERANGLITEADVLAVLKPLGQGLLKMENPRSAFDRWMADYERAYELSGRTDTPEDRDPVRPDKVRRLLVDAFGFDKKPLETHERDTRAVQAIPSTGARLAGKKESLWRKFYLPASAAALAGGGTLLVTLLATRTEEPKPAAPDAALKKAEPPRKKPQAQDDAEKKAALERAAQIRAVYERLKKLDAPEAPGGWVRYEFEAAKLFLEAERMGEGPAFEAAIERLRSSQEKARTLEIEGRKKELRIRLASAEEDIRKLDLELKALRKKISDERLYLNTLLGRRPYAPKLQAYADLFDRLIRETKSRIGSLPASDPKARALTAFGYYADETGSLQIFGVFDTLNLYVQTDGNAYFWNGRKWMSAAPGLRWLEETRSLSLEKDFMKVTGLSEKDLYAPEGTVTEAVRKRRLSLEEAVEASKKAQFRLEKSLSLRERALKETAELDGLMDRSKEAALRAGVDEKSLKEAKSLLDIRRLIAENIQNEIRRAAAAADEEVRDFRTRAEILSEALPRLERRARELQKGADYFRGRALRQLMVSWATVDGLNRDEQSLERMYKSYEEDMRKKLIKWTPHKYGLYGTYNDPVRLPKYEAFTTDAEGRILEQYRELPAGLEEFDVKEVRRGGLQGGIQIKHGRLFEHREGRTTARYFETLVVDENDEIIMGLREGEAVRSGFRSLHAVLSDDYLLRHPDFEVEKALPGFLERYYVNEDLFPTGITRIPLNKDLYERWTRLDQRLKEVDPNIRFFYLSRDEKTGVYEEWAPLPLDVMQYLSGERHVLMPDENGFVTESTLLPGSHERTFRRFTPSRRYRLVSGSEKAMDAYYFSSSRLYRRVSSGTARLAELREDLLLRGGVVVPDEIWEKFQAELGGPAPQVTAPKMEIGEAESHKLDAKLAARKAELTREMLNAADPKQREWLLKQIELLGREMWWRDAKGFMHQIYPSPAQEAKKAEAAAKRLLQAERELESIRRILNFIEAREKGPQGARLSELGEHEVKPSEALVTEETLEMLRRWSPAPETRAVKAQGVKAGTQWSLKSVFMLTAVAAGALRLNQLRMQGTGVLEFVSGFDLGAGPVHVAAFPLALILWIGVPLILTGLADRFPAPSRARAVLSLVAKYLFILPIAFGPWLTAVWPVGIVSALWLVSEAEQDSTRIGMAEILDDESASKGSSGARLSEESEDFDVLPDNMKVFEMNDRLRRDFIFKKFMEFEVDLDFAFSAALTAFERAVHDDPGSIFGSKTAPSDEDYDAGLTDFLVRFAEDPSSKLERLYAEARERVRVQMEDVAALKVGDVIGYSLKPFERANNEVWEMLSGYFISKEAAPDEKSLLESPARVLLEPLAELASPQTTPEKRLLKKIVTTSARRFLSDDVTISNRIRALLDMYLTAAVTAEAPTFDIFVSNTLKRQPPLDAAGARLAFSDNLKAAVDRFIEARDILETSATLPPGNRESLMLLTDHILDKLENTEYLLSGAQFDSPDIFPAEVLWDLRAIHRIRERVNQLARSASFILNAETSSGGDAYLRNRKREFLDALLLAFDAAEGAYRYVRKAKAYNLGLTGARLSLETDLETAFVKFIEARGFVERSHAMPGLVRERLLQRLDEMLDDLERVLETLDGPQYDSPEIFPDEITRALGRISDETIPFVTVVNMLPFLLELISHPLGLPEVQDHKPAFLFAVRDAFNASNSAYRFVREAKQGAGYPSGARLAKKLGKVERSILEADWQLEGRIHLDSSLLEPLQPIGDVNAIEYHPGGHYASVNFTPPPGWYDSPYIKTVPEYTAPEYFEPFYINGWQRRGQWSTAGLVRDFLELRIEKVRGLFPEGTIQIPAWNDPSVKYDASFLKENAPSDQSFCPDCSSAHDVRVTFPVTINGQAAELRMRFTGGFDGTLSLEKLLITAPGSPEGQGVGLVFDWTNSAEFFPGWYEGYNGAYTEYWRQNVPYDYMGLYRDLPELYYPEFQRLGTPGIQKIHEMTLQAFEYLKRGERLFPVFYGDDLIADVGPLTLVGWHVTEKQFELAQQAVRELFRDLDPGVMSRLYDHAGQTVLRMVISGDPAISGLPELLNTTFPDNYLGISTNDLSGQFAGFSVSRFTDAITTWHTVTHEMAHLIHAFGLTLNQGWEWFDLFASAWDRALFYGTYADTNWKEMFAETVTGYMDGMRPLDMARYLNSREVLSKMDGNIVQFLGEIFGASLTDPAQPSLNPDIRTAEDIQRLLQTATGLPWTLVSGRDRDLWSYEGGTRASFLVDLPNRRNTLINAVSRYVIDANSVGYELSLTDGEFFIRVYKGFVGPNNEPLALFIIKGPDGRVNVFDIPTDELRTMTLGQIIIRVFGRVYSPAPAAEKPVENIYFYVPNIDTSFAVRGVPDGLPDDRYALWQNFVFSQTTGGATAPLGDINFTYQISSGSAQFTDETFIRISKESPEHLADLWKAAAPEFKDLIQKALEELDFKVRVLSENGDFRIEILKKNGTVLSAIEADATGKIKKITVGETEIRFNPDSAAELEAALRKQIILILKKLGLLTDDALQKINEEMHKTNIKLDVIEMLKQAGLLTPQEAAPLETQTFSAAAVVAAGFGIAPPSRKRTREESRGARLASSVFRPFKEQLAEWKQNLARGTVGQRPVRNVLINEDDIFMAQSMRRSLKASFPGMDFVLTKKSEEALAAVQQQAFDLILTDRNTKSDMTGTKFIQRLREAEADAGTQTPEQAIVVMISGDLSAALDEPGIDIEAFGPNTFYLSKPALMDQTLIPLIQTVSSGARLASGENVQDLIDSVRRDIAERQDPLRTWGRIQRLGDSKAAEAVPLLVETVEKGLRDRSFDVLDGYPVVQSIGALGKIGSADAVPVLLQALRYGALEHASLAGTLPEPLPLAVLTEVAIRVTAAQALGNIALPESVPYLRAAHQHDPSLEVRGAALNAYWKIHFPMVQALGEDLKRIPGGDSILPIAPVEEGDEYPDHNGWHDFIYFENFQPLLTHLIRFYDDQPTDSQERGDIRNFTLRAVALYVMYTSGLFNKYTDLKGEAKLLAEEAGFLVLDPYLEHDHENLKKILRMIYLHIKRDFKFSKSENILGSAQAISRLNDFLGGEILKPQIGEEVEGARLAGTATGRFGRDYKASVVQEGDAKKLVLEFDPHLAALEVRQQIGNKVSRKNYHRLKMPIVGPGEYRMKNKKYGKTFIVRIVEDRKAKNPDLRYRVRIQELKDEMNPLSVSVRFHTDAKKRSGVDSYIFNLGLLGMVLRHEASRQKAADELYIEFLDSPPLEAAAPGPARARLDLTGISFQKPLGARLAAQDVVRDLRQIHPENILWPESGVDDVQKDWIVRLIRNYPEPLEVSARHAGRLKIQIQPLQDPPAWKFWQKRTAPSAYIGGSNLVLNFAMAFSEENLAKNFRKMSPTPAQAAAFYAPMDRERKIASGELKMDARLLPGTPGFDLKYWFEQKLHPALNDLFRQAAKGELWGDRFKGAVTLVMKEWIPAFTLNQAVEDSERVDRDLLSEIYMSEILPYFLENGLYAGPPSMRLMIQMSREGVYPLVALPVHSVREEWTPDGNLVKIYEILDADQPTDTGKSLEDRLLDPGLAAGDKFIVEAVTPFGDDRYVSRATYEVWNTVNPEKLRQVSATIAQDPSLARQIAAANEGTFLGWSAVRAFGSHSDDENLGRIRTHILNEEKNHFDAHRFAIGLSAARGKTRAETERQPGRIAAALLRDVDADGKPFQNRYSDILKAAVGAGKLKAAQSVVMELEARLKVLSRTVSGTQDGAFLLWTYTNSKLGPIHGMAGEFIVQILAEQLNVEPSRDALYRYFLKLDETSPDALDRVLREAALNGYRRYFWTGEERRQRLSGARLSLVADAFIDDSSFMIWLALGGGLAASYGLFHYGRKFVRKVLWKRNLKESIAHLLAAQEANWRAAEIFEEYEKALLSDVVEAEDRLVRVLELMRSPEPQGYAGILIELDAIEILLRKILFRIPEYGYEVTPEKMDALREAQHVLSGQSLNNVRFAVKRLERLLDLEPGDFVIRAEKSQGARLAIETEQARRAVALVMRDLSQPLQRRYPGLKLQELESGLLMYVKGNFSFEVLYDEFFRAQNVGRPILRKVFMYAYAVAGYKAFETEQRRIIWNFIAGETSDENLEAAARAIIEGSPRGGDEAFEGAVRQMFERIRQKLREEPAGSRLAVQEDWEDVKSAIASLHGRLDALESGEQSEAWLETEKAWAGHLKKLDQALPDELPHYIKGDERETEILLGLRKEVLLLEHAWFMEALDGNHRSTLYAWIKEVEKLYVQAAAVWSLGQRSERFWELKFHAYAALESLWSAQKVARESRKALSDALEREILGQDIDRIKWMGQSLQEFAFSGGEKTSLFADGLLASQVVGLLKRDGLLRDSTGRDYRVYLKSARRHLTVLRERQGARLSRLNFADTILKNWLKAIQENEVLARQETFTRLDLLKNGIEPFETYVTRGLSYGFLRAAGANAAGIKRYAWTNRGAEFVRKLRPTRKASRKVLSSKIQPLLVFVKNNFQASRGSFEIKDLLHLFSSPGKDAHFARSQAVRAIYMAEEQKFIKRVEGKYALTAEGREFAEYFASKQDVPARTEPEKMPKAGVSQAVRRDREIEKEDEFEKQREASRELAAELLRRLESIEGEDALKNYLQDYVASKRILFEKDVEAVDRAVAEKKRRLLSDTQGARLASSGTSVSDVTIELVRHVAHKLDLSLRLVEAAGTARTGVYADLIHPDAFNNAMFKQRWNSIRKRLQEVVRRDETLQDAAVDLIHAWHHMKDILKSRSVQDLGGFNAAFLRETGIDLSGIIAVLLVHMLLQYSRAARALSRESSLVQTQERPIRDIYNKIARLRHLYENGKDGVDHLEMISIIRTLPDDTDHILENLIQRTDDYAGDFQKIDRVLQRIEGYALLLEDIITVSGETDSSAAASGARLAQTLSVSVNGRPFAVPAVGAMPHTPDQAVNFRQLFIRVAPALGYARGLDLEKESISIERESRNYFIIKDTGALEQDILSVFSAVHDGDRITVIPRKKVQRRKDVSVLVAVSSAKLRTEIAGLFRERPDVRVFTVSKRLSRENRLHIINEKQRHLGSPTTLYLDDEDPTLNAKQELVRHIHRRDLESRPLLEVLLGGDRNLSDFSFEEQNRAWEDIVYLLPRIAPKTFGAGVEAMDPDEALRALKLSVFHPSFGLDFTNLAVQSPKSPRAAVWTLPMILKDPFFFDTLNDRDAKLKGKMILEDHVIVQSGTDFKEILGDRYGAFESRFPKSRIHIRPDGSIGSVYNELSGDYKRENVLFIDDAAESSLKQDETTLKLLVLKGAYALALDKVVVQILALGDKSLTVSFKGLTRKGNVFIFSPVVPIDYEKQFRKFYQAVRAAAQAA